MRIDVLRSAVFDRLEVPCLSIQSTMLRTRHYDKDRHASLAGPGGLVTPMLSILRDLRSSRPRAYCPHRM